MNTNANLAPSSFRFMRKDFHQENGHSSDVDQKRSGILLETKPQGERDRVAELMMMARGTDRPHLSWKCAQVTGKAGENGQYSGDMGGSSAWTRPSAPGCGDTLKAPAGDQRSILGGDRPRRRLRGRYRLGHWLVVLFRTETAQCTVRPT